MNNNKTTNPTEASRLFEILNSEGGVESDLKKLKKDVEEFNSADAKVSGAIDQKDVQYDGTSDQISEISNEIKAEEKSFEKQEDRIISELEIRNGQPATPKNIREVQRLLGQDSDSESFLDGAVVYVETKAKGTKEDSETILVIDGQGVRDTLNNQLLNTDSFISAGEYANQEVENKLQLMAAERLIRYWQAHADDKDALGDPNSSADLENIVKKQWFPRFFTTVSLFANALQRHKTQPEISHGEQRIGSTAFAVALETAVKRSVEATRIMSEKAKDFADADPEFAQQLIRWSHPEGLLTEKDSPFALKDNGFPLHPEFWITPDGEMFRTKIEERLLEILDKRAMDEIRKNEGENERTETDVA